MKKAINNTKIMGYVYEHKLKQSVTGENSKNPGTEFINGTLSIATDEEMMNIVQVHFTYVTPVTKTGKANFTYNILLNIIEGKIGTVMDNGKEEAGVVRINSALGLNEWYDTKNGDQLISLKRNEGGFVSQIKPSDLKNENERATFDVDMVITGAIRREPDEERGTPERMTLKGYVFNFRNDALPVELSVHIPAAMDYFEGLAPTSKTPVFTHLRGKQVSQTVIKRVEEESAFGESMITETKTFQRDFVVTWASPETYEWDSEDDILATELIEALSKREIDLAEMKSRQEEYLASKNGVAFGEPPASYKNSLKKDDYNF